MVFVFGCKFTHLFQYNDYKMRNKCESLLLLCRYFPFSPVSGHIFVPETLSYAFGPRGARPLALAGSELRLALHVVVYEEVLAVEHGVGEQRVPLPEQDEACGRVAVHLYV